jgi:hypothetical protein
MFTMPLCVAATVALSGSCLQALTIACVVHHAVKPLAYRRDVQVGLPEAAAAGSSTAARGTCTMDVSDACLVCIHVWANANFTQKLV